ncbi:MAG: hypothetical protein NC095_06570 [Muribaculum sp.]|nr:hypothetical protein [Muribaculum sp.]
MILDGIDITKEIKTIEVPDNDYLPFVPVMSSLRDMEVGAIMLWPLKKANTVKQTVMKLNRDTNRRYKYTSDNTYIKVCRFADVQKS